MRLHLLIGSMICAHLRISAPEPPPAHSPYAGLRIIAAPTDQLGTVTLATRLTQWLTNFDFLSIQVTACSGHPAFCHPAIWYLAAQVPGNLEDGPYPRAQGLDCRRLLPTRVRGHHYPCLGSARNCLGRSNCQRWQPCGGVPNHGHALILDLLDIRAVFSLVEINP